MKLYSRLACVQKRQTCKFSFVLEGGKGGAAAAAERSVDPSRLDLRIGKILTAKKVSTSGKCNGKVLSRMDFLCKSQMKMYLYEFSKALLITFET